MARIASLLFLLLSLLVIAGCDTTLTGTGSPGAAPTAPPALSVQSLSMYFSAEDNPTSHGYGVFALNAADGKVRWHYSIKFGDASQPVLKDGTLYIASNDQHIYAFNTNDGSVRWQVPLTGPSGTPILADQLLYVNTNDGALSALNISDGSVRWRFAQGGMVTTVSSTVTYVSAASVYALNTSDGSIRWSYHSAGDSTALWTVSDNRAYAAEEYRREGDVANNVLHVLNATDGKEEWRFSPGKTLLRLIGGENGVIYLDSSENNTAVPDTLYALNSSDGSIRWKSQVQDREIGSPFFANGMIVIPAYSGDVSALNAGDGKPLWRVQAATPNPALTYPEVLAVSADTIYTFFLNQGLVALNASDGSAKWHMPMQDALLTGTVANGVFYSATHDQSNRNIAKNFIFALNANDGTQVWRYDVGVSIPATAIG